MKTSDELNLQKYLDIFLKYKWHGLLPASALMIALATASLFLPKIYQSHCVVEVDRGTIQNPLKTQRGEPVRLSENMLVFRENAFNWDVLSYVADTVGAQAILENSDVYNLHKAKKKLVPGSAPQPASPNNQSQTEMVTSLLRREIEIRQKAPRFLVLSYRGTDSEVNANILNTLVSKLIEEKESKDLSQAGKSLEFLETETESYRLKLEEAEADLKAFKEEHVSELPDNVNVNLSQLTRDKADVLGCELEIKELTTRLQYLDEELEKQNSLIVSEIRREANPLLMLLNERIVDMEIELTRLRTNYTELHPRVAELRGQLEDLKRQRDEVQQSTVDTETSIRNPVYEQLSQDRQETLVRIEVLKSRIENLNKRIEENEEKVRGVPAQEQELLALTRNYEVTGNIYNMFLQRLEEARIQEKLASEERDSQSFRVIQYARATFTPVGPERLKLAMFIVIIGMGTAVGIITVFNFFDDSLNTVEEAREFLGKPLLGTIPSLNENDNNGALFLRKMFDKVMGRS